MFGRLWAWVRGFSDVATLIQLAGSVGGATVLAILIPAVLQAVLGLPVALRVALGVGIFFVALAVILAVLKAVLERGAGNPGGDAPTSPSRDSASEAPLNPYPPIRDGELHKKLFEKRTVYIADFARKLIDLDLLDPVDLMFNAPAIGERTFVDCRVYGPAVLSLTNEASQIGLFRGSNFYKGDPFWSFPEQGARAGAGVIFLRSCTFTGCRFADVGFLSFPDGRDDSPHRPARDERPEESPTDR